MLFNLLLWCFIGIISLIISKIISIFTLIPLTRTFNMTFMLIDVIIYLIPTIILFHSGSNKKLPSDQKKNYYESASVVLLYQEFKLFFTFIILLILPLALKKGSYTISSLISAILSIYVSV